MREFTIKHKHCGKQEIIFGYDFYDACKRAKLDCNLWIVIHVEYID